MLEDLLSSLPGNLLAIHSTKSLTGYLEISFESAWGPLCLLECLNPIIESPPSKHSQKHSHRKKGRKIMRHLLGRTLFICWSGITKENDICGSRHGHYFPANNFHLLFPQNLPITLNSQNSIVDSAPGEKCMSSTGKTQKAYICVMHTSLIKFSAH